MAALGLVDFCVRTHLNAPHVREQAIREQAKRLNLPVYAIDDYAALQVMDGEVEIVGDGKYLKLN